MRGGAIAPFGRVEEARERASVRQARQSQTPLRAVLRGTARRVERPKDRASAARRSGLPGHSAHLLVSRRRTPRSEAASPEGGSVALCVEREFPFFLA